MKRPLLMATPLIVAALVASGGNAGPTVEPRVGYVAFSGTVPTPRVLDGLPLVGFLRAQKELPIRGAVRYVSPTQAAGTALTAFGRQGYDLVVAPLFNSAPVDSVARSFPHVQFLVVDAQPGVRPTRRAENIHRAVFRAEQAGYLAGYLSALMAGQKGRRTMISAVGGYKFYGVLRWIVGYRAGAKNANPRIVVRVDYSDDFANPAKCRRVALSQIAAGSRVVFDVAGACGVGALRAAREKGVWGVGVDTDLSYLGPHILTSAVSRFDLGVYQTIRQFVRGKLAPGAAIVYDIRNGGVELGRVSPRVPKSFLRRLAKIRGQIAAGTIKVPRPGG